MFAVAGAAASTGAAHAAYPEKPITLLIPFAPGGSSDIIGRLVAPALADKLGQSVVIENISGAGGVVGTQRAVRAPADGYTVLVGSGSEILINGLINPSISYDGQKDLAPVAFIGVGPMVLVGKPELAAGDFSELRALAAREPGALSYASAGNGTPMHVAGELLNMHAGLDLTHVPYRGAAPALVDVMGGQIDLAVSTLSAAQPHIRAGRVKALGTTGAETSALAPDLPALGKQPGLEGFDLGVWFGLFVPTGTPPDVVKALEDAARSVLAAPELRAKLAEQGIEASGESGEALRAFMQGEVEKYQDVVKAANLTLDPAAAK
ncbi:tripartite tricarboxylate transporter substrate binding protein [Verticiella sediminum]|uniref:Tripartite tricarboxylate transporter substrate binding protein n=2 Tax=Verticiella sediminum TaxID=1247510 RepID=A0A556A608_9BURK|nr:tripartite tricarboxylate transporter substrate binding protein [Verticiella sediminum]